MYLYAGTGQREKTLNVAEQVMRTNPDPRAYLAGVYTMLKEYAQAASVLRKELKVEKAVRRKTLLHLQLAEVLSAQTVVAVDTTLLTVSAVTDNAATYLNDDGDTVAKDRSSGLKRTNRSRRKV